jgi:hypothetical protein
MFIIPAITYAATEWCRRVKFKTSIPELDKLQRPVFLGITGARRKASTSAIEVHCI